MNKIFWDHLILVILFHILLCTYFIFVKLIIKIKDYILVWLGDNIVITEV